MVQSADKYRKETIKCGKIQLLRKKELCSEIVSIDYKSFGFVLQASRLVYEYL